MIQTTITKGNCFHQNQPKNREKGITYLKLPPQTNHIPTTDQHQLNPEQNLICAGLAGKPLLCFPGADPADTNPDSEAKSSLAGVWGAHVLEAPVLPNMLMLSRKSHLCTWQHPDDS